MNHVKHARSPRHWILLLIAGLLVSAAVGTSSDAQDKDKAKPKPDFPPFATVSEGYTKVATQPGAGSMYTLWTRTKDSQMLAELPRNFATQKYFIAMTVASGEVFAGLQQGDRYVYWKRYGKRIALIQPNVGVRSTGDGESKSSVDRLFTDRVLLDIPIVSMGQSGGPVIDMDELLLGNASKLFGGSASGMNRRLASIKTAKAFPQNCEISFEVPVSGGILKTFHYSISSVPKSTGYKTREADQRVGFFTTGYQDLGKYTDDKKWTRYINRWHLEKRDPKLKLSPPKKPIVFYIEHTTPVRYRRFVAQGLLSWNKAFENIGIVNAIEARFQDKQTGEHMDKDPEDVRYNFLRWLNNDISTAIGPSRVNPETGQILDADIVLTDGWIRTFEMQFSKLLPQVAMQGFSADTLAWLEQNPQWDPRILLAEPHQRPMILAERAARGPLPFGGHPMGNVGTDILGDDEYDGLVGVTSQSNGLCMAATGRAFDLALLRMTIAMHNTDDDKEDGDKDGDKEEDKDQGAIGDEDMLDGMPARFIGPLLADLVAHEVGHTLGLRHNFKASHLYTFEEINSEEVSGKKPFTASVMDYNPININMHKDCKQGDYAMIDVGPYDMWAIEYGYTFEKDLKPILARSTEAENAYSTDEDTSGPDPHARRYDFCKDPLPYAENQIALAQWHRGRILTDFVADGDSWAKARQGYDMTLGTQMQAVSMMSNWIGGAHVHRDKKGDKGNRAPIEPVPTEKQRKAMNFVIENTFYDDAYGLNPELLRHLTLDKWFTGGDFFSMFQDATYPLHDRIMGIQASAMTMLMNPTTLRRLYDNEHYVDAEADILSLAELLDSVTDAAWDELKSGRGANFTAQKPMVSSLRRNLQREHIDRLTSLSVSKSRSAAFRTISNLATLHLKKLDGEIAHTLAANNLDPYTRAHLEDAKTRISKTLEARYVMNP